MVVAGNHFCVLWLDFTRWFLLVGECARQEVGEDPKGESRLAGGQRMRRGWHLSLFPFVLTSSCFGLKAEDFFLGGGGEGFVDISP